MLPGDWGRGATISWGPKNFMTPAEWILRHNYLTPNIIHYLDDFLIVGKPSSAECEIALQKMLHMMQTVRLSNSREKDRRSNNRNNFPRHPPGYSKDGITPSP